MSPKNARKSNCKSSLYAQKMEVIKSTEVASKEKNNQRKTKLGSFPKTLLDRQFRRYFCMSRDCFHHLCEQIEQHIGWPTFESEQYLWELCPGTIEDNEQNKMNHAYVQSTGGYVSGEVKLALISRMLAGGTCMDLTLLYKVGMAYAYKILHDIVCNWINDDRLININGEDYLNDDR